MPSNAMVSRSDKRTVANPEMFGYGFETLTRMKPRVWTVWTLSGTGPCGKGHPRSWPSELRTASVD